MYNRSFAQSVQERYTSIYESKNDHILNEFKVFTLDYIKNLERNSNLLKTKNLGLEPYGIKYYAPNNPITFAGIRHLQIESSSRFSDIRSDT